MMSPPIAQAEVTADGIVSARPGALVGIILTGGSDLATVIIYDNASAASGTKLATIKAAANTTTVWECSISRSHSKGLYADITGTDAVAYIGYW